MSVRTLIIEDEAPAYRRLSGLLAQHHPALEVVDVLDSIEGALRWFAENPAPDLLFSDIQLSDGLSFEIYRQAPPPCPIIFTTAYDAYMLEAFRTNGIDYLLKPIEEEDLARSIAKFEALVRRPTPAAAPDIERFLVKSGTKLLPVPIAEAAYFLSSDGITELHTREGRRHLIDLPLDDLERQLDPAVFFRLNRQCIACVQCIALVHPHFNGKLKVELKPATPIEVMVSREKARAFRDWLDGVR
jgi:DNA-binding LytR/AlgR family response regulator